VAYKPRRSKNLIVFEERQIASINVELSRPFSSAHQNIGEALEGSYKADGNTCSVTLNEPYLDGVTWQTLRDTDRAAAVANVAALDNMLLPKCKPGESPDTTKCAEYSETNDFVDNEPFLIITLWYTLEGINETNSATFYYKIVSTTIKHGDGNDPQVTIRGRHAYEIIFQENVSPKFFEKGASVVDEMNKKIFNSEGYILEDVCSTPADELKNERTYRVNGLTGSEILNKFMSDVEDSQVLTLPTKEFANNIQICSKGDKSCYASRVFYLGKGLYENYKIDSSIPTNAVEANISSQNNTPIIPGEIKAGENLTYEVSLINTFRTIRKFRQIDLSAFSPFEGQFEDLADYSTADGGNGWKGIASGASPNIKFKLEKIEKKKLYGLDKGAKTFLGGKVLKVDDDSVKIQTGFYVHLCNEERKCFRMTVHEEFKKLKSVSIKENDVVAPGASVGETETEAQNHSLFRFFAKAAGGDEITLDPTTLKGVLSYSVREPDEENAPTNNSSDGVFVGKVGSTGNSSGPHLHVQESTSSTLTEAELYNLANSTIKIGGKSISSWNRERGFGAGGGHNGIDINGAGIDGKDLTISGTIVASGPGVGGADCGNGVAFTPSGGGPELLLCHLQDASIPSNLVSGSSGVFSTAGNPRTGGPSGPGVAKEGVQLETDFKGVPKALEILPGRTILSFISDYDDWIQNGKDNAIDPGVWIPELYRSWMITKTIFEWNNGDLRVKLNCNRSWSVSRDVFLNNIPTFEEYNSDGKYTDYYDYIRSSGDLCYTTASGENSCAVYCRPGNNTGANQPGGPNSVVGNFPEGACQYTGTRFNQNTVNSLLNAAQSGLGINNKFGLAGILGNAGWESAGFNPQATGPSGEKGLFQWNPQPGAQRLQKLQAYAQSQNLDYLTVEAQVKFFVYEVQNQGYSNLPAAMNSATSVEDAVKKFEEIYEKAEPAAVNYPGRNEIANHIYQNLSCR